MSTCVHAILDTNDTVSPVKDFLAAKNSMHDLPWLVILALNLWAIDSVLACTGSAAHKHPWILLILCLPAIGSVFYLLVGRGPADARV